MRTLVLLSFLTTTFGLAQNNYYFGNLHAHTAFSDGNKDSLASGMTSPAAAYSYAKASGDFDFLGISEHNHYSALRNPGFKRHRYAAGISMANAANEEGTFLTLYGMEYGVSSAYHGHVLIYGMDSLIGWENSVPGVQGNNYDIYNAKSDYDGLFRKIKNRPQAFAYLAHPWFSDYSPDGTSSGGLGNAPYNAAYDSAIVGMPLRNGLATSSLTTYNDYSTGNYFDYYRKLLAIGYHLGIGYDHDTHYSNFGRSNGGRLVLIAPSLTRSNLMQAMQKMRFYGSDDSNAKVEFSINGQQMGSVLSGNGPVVLSVVHNDPDGELADSIRIWKGYNNNTFGTWSWVVHNVLQNNTASFTDNNLQPGKEYHYFAELRQTDGHWIVTSPVWYTRTGTGTDMEELQSPVALTLFPNPAQDHLSISVSECTEYQLSLNDALGRTVLNDSFNEMQRRIDLQGIEKGIYFLILRNEKNTIIRKLVLN